MIEGGEKPKDKYCSHIKKLSKKSLQALVTTTFDCRCGQCETKFDKNANADYWICLHCGQLLCYQKESCIYGHFNKDDHYFCLKIRIQPYPTLSVGGQKKEGQKSQILCKNCSSVTMQLSQKANNEEETQQLAKLTRFASYIDSLNNQICQNIEQNWKHQEQNEVMSQIKPLGLVNLGNTCFLNVVLQSLLRTPSLTAYYSDWEGLLTVARKKKNRKFIEMFYDEIIEKEEENKWHIVSQKSKSKKNKFGQGEEFLHSNIVKDTKFNMMISDFVKIFMAEEEANEGISLEPVEILHKLGDFDKKYQLKGEQDAEQLLIFILDLLSQGQFLTICGVDKDKKQRYDKIQALLGRQKLTPLQNIFGTYLASRISCLSCFRESWALDFTYHFSIPLTNPTTKEQIPPQIQQSTLSLEPIPGITYFSDLFYPKIVQTENPQEFRTLSHFFSPQRLTLQKNYFKCEECAGLAALKQFYIVEPPQNLVISLKRFDPHQKLTKNNKYIAFPQTLDLVNYTLQPQERDEKTLYSLYSVIVHLGDTINSGHYVCYVKHKESKNIWFRYSDTTIRKVQLKEVLQQDAYILLYEKMDPQSE